MTFSLSHLQVRLLYIDCICLKSVFRNTKRVCRDVLFELSELNPRNIRPLHLRRVENCFPFNCRKVINTGFYNQFHSHFHFSTSQCTLVQRMLHRSF